MDSVAVTVPLRPPAKKMKKRKELDALAPPHAVSRRSSGKRSSQELLSESSDERSEYWNVSTAVRGGGGRLKARGRGGPERGPCRGLLRACSVFLGGTVLLVTAVLIWLFIDVRQQLTALRAELDQVIAGSEGLPDTLQTFHTLDRDFKSNITHINKEIEKLNKSLISFSGQIVNLQQELQQVQGTLKSAPELTSVPNTVKALQNNIGQLEIDIHDLQTTNKMLKDSTFSLQQAQEEQRLNLTKIESTLSGLSNTTQQPQQTVPTNETLIETRKLWDAIAQLGKNLTQINQTLTMNITWALEDLANDHKKVVSLQDMAQNASAQILTLQQECVKRKDYEVLQGLLQTMSTRVDRLSEGKSNQEGTQPNSPDVLMSSLTDAKSQQASQTDEQSSMQRKLQNSEATTESNYKTSAAQEALPVNPSTTARQLSLDNRN